ncbi:MAG: hypothetical protein AAFO94_13520, partial [Bacteroidota bacterium]
LDFVLLQYPIKLLKRSTCELFGEVVTDEEGVFTLEDFTPEDLIVEADPSGMNTWSVIPAGSFRKGQLVDVPVVNLNNSSFSNFTEFITVDDLNSDTVLLEFRTDIPSFPMEKATVEIFSSVDGIDVSTQPDMNGQVSVDLPVQSAGVLNLQITLKDNFGQIVNAESIQLTVQKSFSANLRAELTPCRDIKLIWDAYDGNDFQEYQISYKSQYQPEFEDCTNASGFLTIFEQNTTEAIITDYTRYSELCISLRTVTTQGVTNKNEIDVSQPFSDFIEADMLQRTDFLPNGNIIFYYEDIVDARLVQCKKDAANNTITCQPDKKLSGQIAYSGTVDGQYRVVDQQGDNFSVLNENLEVQHSFTIADAGPQVQIVAPGLLVAFKINGNVGLQTVDLRTNESGQFIELSNDLEFVRFAVAPSASAFTLIARDRATLVDWVYVYEVADKDNVTLINSFRLNIDFIYQPFFSSPDGKTLISEDGLIMDLEATDGAVFQPFESAYRTGRNLINNQYVVLQNASDDKLVLYDYKNKQTISERSRCASLLLGLNANNELYIAKGFQEAFGFDYTNPFQ